jgi:endonuclease/exonuclease/phosphatase family metal-dependent hydrolase
VAVGFALILPALAGATSAGADAGVPEAGDRPVRVMSFNIHHGRGLDGVVDLERVASAIEDADADVVGLQEVDRHWSERSDFVDQASVLARRLNMHLVYGANLDRDPLEPAQPRRQYGTAILSDHPILEWRNVLLPRTGTKEQRGLLEARVNVRGVPVLVYNTHLQHDSQSERTAQIEAIRQIIGTPEDSVVLVGDLNARPDTPEIAAITEQLRDAWVAAGIGEGYTYPAEDPAARIDYVLTSADVVARAAAVVTSDASDHLPVHADVALPGSKVGVGRATASNP